MNRSHRRRLALLMAAGIGACSGALVLAACAGRPRGDDSLPLPGDDLVPGATVIETHQIDIDAPATAVWPWLVQLGYERGGFYSFDLLERLAGVGITNTWRIESQWQDLAVGDRVRLAADAALTVVRLEPGRCLVLSSDGGVAPPGAGMDFDFSWAFVLDELDDHGSGHCRLRIRERYLPRRGTTTAVVWAMRPVARFMTRGMMWGLRRRAQA